MREFKMGELVLVIWNPVTQQPDMEGATYKFGHVIGIDPTGFYGYQARVAVDGYNFGYHDTWTNLWVEPYNLGLEEVLRGIFK